MMLRADPKLGVVEMVAAALGAFLMDEFDALSADTQFTDRLTWLLPPENQSARLEIVIMRMRKIAGL